MNKNNLIKKIISLSCAILLIVSTVLAGLPGNVFASADTAPPTDFTELSWDDFGLEYKEYVAPNPDAGARGSYSSGLNNTLLNDDIVIGKGVDIRYAGAEGWNGLRINVVADASMSYISLESNGYGTVTSGGTYLKLYPASELNVDTVVDKQFNLKISTEISGNSYTFGVWVNDIMLGGYITMTANSGVTGNYVGFYAYEETKNNVTLVESLPELPVGPVEPPTDFTELGWEDFAGLEYKEYVAPNPDTGAKGAYAESLNRTLLNADIIIGKGVDIRYAGAEGWNGLRINVVADASMSYISLESNGYGNVTFGSEYLTLYPASTLNVDTVVDKEFNLKISTEITDNTYVFGVWVNDVMLGGYVRMTANSGVTGNYVGFYAYEAPQNNVTLVEPQPELPVGPVEPPTDFTELGWTDFAGLELKEYVKPSPDASKGTIGTYSASLNETLLNGNIILGAETDIRYAGQPTNPGWSGLVIRAQSDGTLLVNSSTFDTPYNETYNPADYDLISFAGVEFNLKISTKIEGNNYTFGIWVNNKMLGDYFTLAESEGGMGNIIGLYDTGRGNNITLLEAVSDDETIAPPTDFTELSWEDFGFTYKEYVKPSPDASQGTIGTYSASLNETLLNGNIILGAETDIRYAGQPTNPGWSGLVIRAQSDGTLLVNSSTFDTPYNETYNPADYDLISFAGVEFNLKISTKIEGNNYTFGIWVNNKMLGDYFTLAESEGGMGNIIGLYDTGRGNNVTLVGTTQGPVAPPAEPDVPPAEPIPVPSDFTVVILDDFNGQIRPGALASEAPIAGQLTTQDDFDEVVFSADVNLSTKTPGDATYIRFAGASEGWVGIGFETRSNGTLVLMNWANSQNLQTYTTDKAGFDFFEKAFNLKVSFEYVDADDDGQEDDVQIGVYFNDVLYNNQLVVAKDYEMTNYLLAYTDDASAHPLEINNPKKQNVTPIQPDDGLKEISFSSFNIADAEFTEINIKDFCVSGAYRDLAKGKTLDGTLFHGEIYFGKNGGSQLRLGGQDSAWCGLVFLGNADGSLTLVEAEMDAPEKQFSYLFNSYEAGCELVGTWLDLKVSTQFVDSDKDGAKDDVKLGIWFNDVLYQNEYIYLCDYAQHMGSYLSIYCSNPEGYIAIRSAKVDDKIELTLYGFDDNYKSRFKTAEKDSVEGEPFGVTAEYETVDYSVAAKQAVSGDTQKTDDETVGQSRTLPYVILAASGVALAAILIFVVCLIMRKKKTK